MSHETNTDSNYSQEQIDHYTEERILHQAELIRHGARYDMGHFVISRAQYGAAHSEMQGQKRQEENAARHAQVDLISIDDARNMEPANLERLTRESIWNVLSLRAVKGYGKDKTTLSFAEDMGISPDDQGTGYVEFVPVGKQVKQDGDYYKRAITMSLDGTYVGVSNKRVSGNIDQTVARADEAIMDITVSTGRQTGRFSGASWNGVTRHGSHEASLEERVYVVNLLDGLSFDEAQVKAKIGGYTRAVYRKAQS
jgi:hypothetical protein